MEQVKKRGRPRKVVSELQADGQGNSFVEKHYASGPTDFDQVAIFQQLFANIFDRNRKRSMAEVLDYILQDGGAEMDNKKLIERTNMLGLRADLYTPQPNEGKTPEV